MTRKELLLKELEKYEKKVAQLTRDWSETKGGSRYGDEYGEMQIKVYQRMIEDVKRELKAVK